MKPEKIRIDHCPTCASARILELGVRRNYYLHNLDLTVPVEYSICADCQLIFQSDYVGDAFLNHYYSRSPMLRRKEPTAFERDQNRRQAEFVARHVGLDGLRVLEIGAHAGAFLMHLQEHFGCTAYFDELSEEARSVLASQPGLLDFRAAGASKVDLVVLRHVLEHIRDLDSFLGYVASILDDGGSLFIEVPDWSHFDSHTDPFIFEHLNQFNTGSLLRLLERNGWKLEALEKSIHPDDPATPNRVQRVVARRSKLPLPGDPAIVGCFREFAAVQYDAWKLAVDQLLAGPAKGAKIALYPASHLSFEAIGNTRLGAANVVGMFDIDAKKQGCEIMGIKVYAPEKLQEIQPDFILVFTMGYEREIRESFDRMGLTARVISITELVQASWKRP